MAPLTKIKAGKNRAEARFYASSNDAHSQNCYKKSPAG